MLFPSHSNFSLLLVSPFLNFLTNMGFFSISPLIFISLAFLNFPSWLICLSHKNVPSEFPLSYNFLLWFQLLSLVWCSLPLQFFLFLEFLLYFGFLLYFKFRLLYEFIFWFKLLFYSLFPLIWVSPFLCLRWYGFSFRFSPLITFSFLFEFSLLFNLPSHKNLPMNGVMSPLAHYPDHQSMSWSQSIVAGWTKANRDARKLPKAPS